MHEPTIWIRKNGIAHAFSRELGCDCRRCRTINFALTPPPRDLDSFPGWDDPPWRAHTSASILVGEPGDDVQGHVLLDCGAGVVDSLVCSGLNRLDSLSALLITHWHPDHVLGINQLCEGLRRSVEGKGRVFEKVPVYCSLGTYNRLMERGGFRHEFGNFLLFHEVRPEVPFTVNAGAIQICFAPLPVAHGRVHGAVIFVASVGSKKVVFAWDIDVPSATVPNDTRTNQQVIDAHLRDSRPDLLFMATNTWRATGTGHTSYEQVRKYVDSIEAREVYLTHLSGHEDDGPGHGWTDAEWENAVRPDGIRVARQGMVIRL